MIILTRCQIKNEYADKKNEKFVFYFPFLTKIILVSQNYTVQMRL